MQIRLTQDDLREGARVGRARYAYARRHGLGQVGGSMSDDLRQISDILGAQAEIAASKLLGLPWNASEVPNGDPDVGPYGIRHTRYATGGLLIRHKDPLDRVMVLVTGSCGVFQLRGWMQVLVARTFPESRPDIRRKPCWCIDQKDLDPDVQRLKTLAIELEGGQPLIAA